MSSNEASPQPPKKKQKSSKSKEATPDQTKDWPLDFIELKKIHFRLNSYYTFLSSRKHIVPKFETLKQPVEKTINRELLPIDVAKLLVLLPDDVLFKYVDENQLITEKKEFTWEKGHVQKDIDMFQLKDLKNDSYNNQVLVFEFIDGDLSKSKTKSTFYTEMKVPNYTPESMKKLINKRDIKFINSVNDFLKNCAIKEVDPEAELLSKAESLLPKSKTFEDPIQEMIKHRKLDSNEERPSIVDMIDILKPTNYKDQIVGSFVLENRVAVYQDLNFEISQNLKTSINVKNFYSHQADALNAIHSGENVIITTSTSSGKSLIYQIPVLNSLETNPDETSMYIFPTKALAQDQKRSFIQIMTAMGLKSIVDTYDGDTDLVKRKNLKENSRVIFTNPDMLHTSILPNHQNWRHFLINLKFVVIDELHYYKGLFGSHVSLIIRRLRRLCSFLGNDNIQFISCSATLKSPIQHMASIFGIDNITHISRDGSPTGEKHLIVWNPPLVNAKDLSSGRENFISETAKILVKLILNNVRTIAFCYVRRVCELLMKEVRNIFIEMKREDLVSQVMSYRGGYSVSDRRQIEQEMFHGNLSAIISTNALELGIDIGGLDSVLMCGFPLSLSNFFQQSGRAGRRNKDSLTLVVGSDSPVDQHYMKHPELLMDYQFQDLILDFENIMILEGHLQCAAFELPIVIQNDSVYFPNLGKVIHKLENDKDGYHTSNRYLPWPSKHVSIRGIEEDQYAVVDVTNTRNIIIEEIEASRTSFTLYEGGIFIHQGYPYLIREFSPEDRFAKVERVDVDWITSQRDFTDVDPKEIELVRSLNNSDIPIFFGKILTTITVFGFFKIDKNKKIIDAVEVHNPPIEIHSKGFWIDLPTKALDLLTYKQLNAAGGIHAAQHAIIAMLPLFIVSGVEDITTECKAPEKEFAERQTSRKRPARLIFYDSKGGRYGSGLCSKAFEHIGTILKGALKRILECSCDWGCPDCVAASFCKENSLVMSKPAALIILYVILGEEFDLDSIPDGPEPNMPDIKIETIVPTGLPVKFSTDVQIIDAKEIENGVENVIKIDENGDDVITNSDDEFANL